MPHIEKQFIPVKGLFIKQWNTEDGIGWQSGSHRRRMLPLEVGLVRKLNGQMPTMVSLALTIEG